MQVKDIMTKDIVIADTNDTIIDVAKLMAHHNIGCIPVTENGEKVLGVITDRDIVVEKNAQGISPQHRNITQLSCVFFSINGNTNAYTAICNSGFKNDHNTPKNECLYFPPMSFVTLLLSNSL